MSISSPTAATADANTPDPLLALLQRYESEVAAFDQDVGTKVISDREWDRIAEDTWSRTQVEILERRPPAITPAAAISALDHVMRSEYLFGEREEAANEQMLWLLIKAARDYIATAEAREPFNNSLMARCGVPPT